MELIEKMFKIKLLDDSVYFKITFVLWTLVHSLSLGQYITSYASPIIILWGGLLVIKKLLFEGKGFPKRYYILIFAFLLSYVITIIVNIKMNLVGNTKTLIWCIIMMIALFINDFNKSKEEILSDIYRVCRAVVVGTLIISGISILLFLFNINFWVNRVDGSRIPQGYYAARLWGIYVDPNQSCNVAIISMALSAVLLVAKRSLNKIILIINIIVQYELIVLSGSRGGEIGFIFFLTCVLYLFIEKRIELKINNKTLRVSLSIILGLILTIALMSTFKLNRKYVSFIPKTVHNTIDSSKDHEIDNITVERPDVETSNGRIELWTDALRLSKQIPIFGVGDRNIMLVAQEKIPGASITDQYVHNGYLHMLLAGGIVGLVIMMVLIIEIVVSIINKIFTKKRANSEYFIYGIISAMIGSMLLTTVFLTEVFYQNSFTATILWIFMGYIIYLNKKEIFTCK
ncbi:O-antigen ligase family protein [Clostridium sp. AL.422]|uniref:O-antigen ligase family protein n=1 Tax=Clostridium TaxID=1485 RepID=UPI00293DA5C3|nr:MULTISPECIES: O-antigen ligase family protein [unclassified Clostridium]MDV4152777.1 O-antigen ligase family protein [Clostridium sp. AL.422]